MWSLTAEGFLTLTCIFEMLSLDPSRPPPPAFLGTPTQLSSLLLSSRKLRADVAPTPSESLSLSPGLNLPCLFILCECVCAGVLCVSVCRRSGSVVQVWTSDDDLWESGPSSHRVGLSQAVRPGGKRCHLLSPPTSPQVLFVKSLNKVMNLVMRNIDKKGG